MKSKSEKISDWKVNAHNNKIWFWKKKHESYKFQGCDVVTPFNSWQPQTLRRALGNTEHIFLYLRTIVLFFIAGDISKAISLKVPSSPIKWCPYRDRLGDNLFKMSSSLPITLVHMWDLGDLQVYGKLILSRVTSWRMNVVWQSKEAWQAYKQANVIWW